MESVSATVLKKITSAKRAEAKQKLGNGVIARMESGIKRLRSEPDEECDDDEESDESIGVVSAAYKLENKIPELAEPETSLPSKKVLRDMVLSFHLTK